MNKVITTDQPHCPACGRTLKGGIVKGTTECDNCGAKVEVTVTTVLQYETKVVG